MQDHGLTRAASISLRQLRLFEGVGRLKSIRRASDECNLSQPAVTQSLAKLETQLGATLLDRATSGSYLTELGTILHRRSTRFFHQIEEAIAELGGSSAAQAATVARRLTRSQLRSILLVTDHLSFADAARLQGLSAASLQRASHDLERNVGRQLYRRSASGVTGTPEGLVFARKIKLAMQEIEVGVREVDAAQGRAETRIVLGAMPTGGSVLLGSILDEFVDAYPQARVRITTSSSPEILNSLLSGDVDLVLGLIPAALGEELCARPLATTPYEIVGRRGHRLLNKGVVTVDDLASYDWVAGAPRSSRREAFDQIFQGRPGPRLPIETCSMPVIQHLLAASSRLTLMTSFERIYQGESLAVIPFQVPVAAPSIGLMTRKNWLPTSLHLCFVELLQRRLASAHVPHIVAQTG